MGSAPYIEPKLGGGPIFVVSVSQLDAKQCPGNYLPDLRIVAAATIDISLSSSMAINRERGRPATGSILHESYFTVLLMAAVLSGHGYDR
jgi:hypothetical protein